MTARRRAHACTSGALACLTLAATAITVSQIAAISALAGGVILAAYAGTYRTEARRAARAALPAVVYPDPQPMPDWEPPPLPRRDTYRLDDAEQAAFEEISRHYDHGTAA